jgi:hypothetical protein
VLLWAWCGALLFGLLHRRTSTLAALFAVAAFIGYAQNKGHWADIGGNVPGSFDVNAKEHFSEGLRITPVRVWHRGKQLHDRRRSIAERDSRRDMERDNFMSPEEAVTYGLLDRVVEPKALGRFAPSEV